VSIIVGEIFLRQLSVQTEFSYCENATQFNFAVCLVKCWTEEFVVGRVFSLQAHRVDLAVRVAIRQGAITKQPAVHTSMKACLDLTDRSKLARRLVTEHALNIRRKNATFAVDLATTLLRRNRPFKLSQGT